MALILALAVWFRLKNKKGFMRLPSSVEGDESVDIEMTAVEMWEEEIAPAPFNRRELRNTSTLPREMEEESGERNNDEWDDDEETTTCVI